jgi:hypothetical protein
LDQIESSRVPIRSRLRYPTQYDPIEVGGAWRPTAVTPDGKSTPGPDLDDVAGPFKFGEFF